MNFELVGAGQRAAKRGFEGLRRLGQARQGGGGVKHFLTALVQELDQRASEIGGRAEDGRIGKRTLDRDLHEAVGFELFADLSGREAAKTGHVGDDAEGELRRRQPGLVRRQDGRQPGLGLSLRRRRSESGGQEIRILQLRHVERGVGRLELDVAAGRDMRQRLGQGKDACRRVRFGPAVLVE